MATIEVGISRSPYAYNDADMGRADFNDPWPTEVTVSATVTNSGTANGPALLSLWNLAVSGPEGGGGPVDTDRANVYAAQIGVDDDIVPQTASLTVVINLPTDVVVDFVAEVTDGDGNLLASRAFTVNPYTIPTAPILSAGNIDVRVV